MVKLEPVELLQLRFEPLTDGPGQYQYQIHLCLMTTENLVLDS